MATQWLIVASLAGESAAIAERLIQAWRVAEPNPSTIDRFCSALRQHGTALPIVYFCEWVDRWLMGDLVPGAGAVEGRRFQATCLSPEQAVAWAGQCGSQFPEQEWLAARLREAAGAWSELADRRVIVVIREGLGGTATDDEERAALGLVPDWISALRTPAEGSVG